jgi:glucose/arabinose dehydrogenase
MDGRKRSAAACVVTAVVVIFGAAVYAQSVGPGVPALTVREGYRVTLAVDDLPQARFLEVDERGTLYVSRPNEGEIVSFRDADGDGVFETRAVFVSDRKTAHGMYYTDGWLWFTQTDSIHRARDTDGDGTADEVETVIAPGTLPHGGGHWWRSILVTGDAIYTSIGDSGNITDEHESERQKIWRFGRDGGGKTLFASGLRNTEKLRLRPGTSEIWGVDHGSDWYGRELGERRDLQPVTNRQPPDEFNHYVEGGFYGHPFIVGDTLPRLEFHGHPEILELAARTTPPKWSFGAHWAANAFTFLTRDHFPADHKGDAFVACRGSWNSSVRVGYRIQRVLFDKLTGEPYGSLRIVSTLSPDGGEVLARPVDCCEAPDGSVLWSCDFSGRVYRITYVGEK